MSSRQPHTQPGVGAARKRQAGKFAMPTPDLQKLVADLEAEMFTAADQLKFEYAAKLRDEIKELSRELARRGRDVGAASAAEGATQPAGTYQDGAGAAARRDPGGARIEREQRGGRGGHGGRHKGGRR